MGCDCEKLHDHCEFGDDVIGQDVVNGHLEFVRCVEFFGHIQQFGHIQFFGFCQFQQRLVVAGDKFWVLSRGPRSGTPTAPRMLSNQPTTCSQPTTSSQATTGGQAMTSGGI